MPLHWGKKPTPSACCRMEVGGGRFGSGLDWAPFVLQKDSLNRLHFARGWCSFSARGTWMLAEAWKAIGCCPTDPLPSTHSRAMGHIGSYHLQLSNTCLDRQLRSLFSMSFTPKTDRNSD